MKKRDLEKKLRDLGWYPIGGTKHEKWTNGQEIEMVPRHTEIAEPLARKIIRKAEANPGRR